MISKEVLLSRYVQQQQSAAAIAKQLRCSEHKVNYWLAKHSITKRSISDAIYTKWNPNGDPFTVRTPQSLAEAILYGTGIGLYWGEGTKKSKTAVRLGNSDPRLIRLFMKFLIESYVIERARLRFGLQIFGDMDQERALQFWIHELGVSRKQFYTPIITPHRGVGNYRQKTKYGVLTLYFNNRKLRDILCDSIESISNA